MTPVLTSCQPPSLPPPATLSCPVPRQAPPLPDSGLNPFYQPLASGGGGSPTGGNTGITSCKVCVALDKVWCYQDDVCCEIDLVPLPRLSISPSEPSPSAVISTAHAHAYLDL